jgi:hypothetical protein
MNIFFVVGTIRILQLAPHFQQADAVTKTEDHPFPVLEEKFTPQELFESAKQIKKYTGGRRAYHRSRQP